MSENQFIAKVETSETNRMSRILVGEDSLIQAHQLAEILAAEHLEVETAVDAEQGFFLFQTKDFDLVISDILLPGMSGYELCAQIKNNSTKSDVPVILVTSLSDPMDIIKGLECGANNFISKPYQADYLLARGRTFLDRKTSRSNSKDKVGTRVFFQGKALTVKSDREQI